MRRLVHMDTDSVEHVCNAIIGQAIKDYTSDPNSAAGGNARIFFRSGWFVQISNGLDGEAVLEKIDRKLMEFQNLCRKNKPKVWRDTKEANKCIFSCPFCGGKVKIVWGRDSLKGFNAKSYTHQCEVCGVRQSVEYNGTATVDIAKGCKCENCDFFKPSRGRHFSCLKHNSYTAPTSRCQDWQGKEV